MNNEVKLSETRIMRSYNQDEHLTVPKILIVDDDPSLLRLLSIRLSAAGYEVESAASAKIALGTLQNFIPEVVISDLRMEGMDGMALFEQIRIQHPNIPVVIMTAHGTIPDAINATKQGVFSFLTKPFESQELLDTVEQAIRLQPVASNIEVANTDYWRKHIISRSTIMAALLNQAKQIANSDFSVLIHSESGTGKELLAQAIHQASHRRDEVFTAINCAAIPEQLLESELFGHVKGAFTGAERNHQGLFQATDGGTLFLDEIGDMPLSFQVKLLRVIQEREIRPVGSTKAIRVDVRIISATHINLPQAIKAKTFREDLYYRLNVVELALPTLVQRREDIPLLVQYFLSQAVERSKVAIKKISQEAMELLISAPWPGNIRQLQNVIEQSIALSSDSIINENTVKNALRDDSTQFPSFQQAREHFERDYLAKLLKITAGNVSQAARIAQRNRTEFYKLLNRHHLVADSYRDE